jgi:hypothetical protein
MIKKETMTIKATKPGDDRSEATILLEKFLQKIASRDCVETLVKYESLAHRTVDRCKR